MKIAFCKAEDIDGRKEVLYMLHVFLLSVGISQKLNSQKKYIIIDNNKIINLY